jgi:ABC-2 type transport system ATP-binding protein
MSIVIETKNLTKYYGKHRGIEELNLSVNEGEIFGFLGPNGAGKSTTIKLLLDFIKPTSGKASVLGLDPEKDIIKINQDIGYLPGEVHMYEQLSGRDQLSFQASLLEDVNWSYVEELGKRLKAEFKKPIKSLSHGNKQKIALIGALMQRPKLLILDEPTTGLDPLIQQEFYKILDEVNKEGTTVFISSHILPEVERICDRVAIIREGKLVVTEEINILKSKASRPIEVIFSQTPKREDFEKIKEIFDLEIEGTTLRCFVRGSYDQFIKALAKHEVMNFITHEPNLEEIFLKYYKGDN